MSAGNLYFNTASLYDLDNRPIIQDDILFYIKYASRTNGNILEMACGTGRISLALLESTDNNIDAFDLSSNMLKEFQIKLAHFPIRDQERISIHCLNLSDFVLNKIYSLIILPWRSFQYITDLNDAKLCLTNTVKHMDKQSIFILSIFNPNANYNKDWLGKTHVAYEYIDDQKNLHITRSTTNLSVDTNEQIITYSSNFHIKEKNQEQVVTDIISQRYYYNHQIKELLNCVGLQVINEYGYYDESAISESSEQILICQLK